METVVHPDASLLDRVGNTPLLRIRRLTPANGSVGIFAKAEWMNPGGSVKDRAALYMIEDGEKSGKLHEGMVILDATSGNTGISYAWIAAIKGYCVELAIASNVSEERKKILQAYGVLIHYSDPLEGSDGAQILAQRLEAENPGRYFVPGQYVNPSNWKAHYETTGPEIWRQTEGRVTHLVATIGTSGTLMGTLRYLKEQNPDIKAIAVEPEMFHGIEGLKHMASSIVPKIYDESLLDDKLTVRTEDGYEYARQLASTEGIFAGQSSGAAIWGAIRVAEQIRGEGLVVTIFPDGGDKYFSTPLWEAQ